MSKKFHARYHRLNVREREEISRLLASGESICSISKKLNRNPSTISREINQPGFGRKFYRALLAEQRTRRKRSLQGRKRRLEIFPKLKRYIIAHLKKCWSPEQIAKKLVKEYPHDEYMRISPETIYSSIYILPKGELKKQLTQSLRRQHKYRYKKNSKKGGKYYNIPNLVSIDKRPKEVDGRLIPGHWEGDLLVGKLKRSYLGTLVERTTRILILVPLKSHNHTEVAQAFAREIVHVPRTLRLSLTYDRGTEMASHQKFTKKTQTKVYFAHPKSPWERGTNENTNMLVRQFFPKGTDFSLLSRREIKKVQRLINGRPRKTLDWKTPEEVFYELLR